MDVGAAVKSKHPGASEQGPDGYDGPDGIPGKDGLNAEDVMNEGSQGCFMCPQRLPSPQGPSGPPGIRGMRRARG
ncbi:unnamed protein product [Haemonchus placei]|uniref:Collagen triple helix repeat protein n=1 Tax=Haemonchus placei TaxID=6290 RepID=A0A0N4WBA8_HAEPC|nr:unnamed protein product [Haemonchus placei]